MVVKIYAPAPSTSSAVQYNERKVAEGKASVIFSSNIDDPRNPMKTFEQYENGSLRTEKMSFHASINPSITDNMTDEQVQEFARRYMEKMGYGGQPFILYKHTDTGRIHYHLVSVRVDENGRKVPDFRERKHSQEIMKELAPEFGYTVGKKKEMDQIPDNPEEEPKEAKDFNPYNGFDPEKGDYGEQLNAIIELAKTYYFTQTDHFDLIMESLGIRVLRTDFEGHENMEFQGLDPKTKEPCTPIMALPDEHWNLPEWTAIHARMSKGQIKTREKERVANLAKTALKKCNTELHTRRYLSKCGIYLKLSTNVDGRIFGVTFVDHHNKCVFKASDLPDITASMFEEARVNKWEVQKDWDEKEKVTAEDAADIALAALGAERSRRNEDEQIMKRGRRGPN
ncbi:MAG: relaxase/mobilization nuclease domain-containing protein [Bacteroidales bacterium]|nr:relaxase/mobilization nuclease domain-containing protein [Bacteroidales bacterium]